jgi:hypothetical protein
VEEVRKNFAYNIVGVMYVLDGRHIEIVMDCYVDSLLNDQNREVRSLLIASFHEMVHLIGVILLIIIIEPQIVEVPLRTIESHRQGSQYGLY